MADSRARALRAVEPGEAPRVSKSVTEAAKSGTTRELMAAMRDRIAIAVEDPSTPARDLAALTKRLAETVQVIEAIDARAGEEVGDGVEVSDGTFDAAAV